MEAVLELGGDQFQIHCPQARGGQLERQGNAIQVPADTGHGFDVRLVKLETRQGHFCSAGEQVYGGIFYEFFRGDFFAGFRERQGWDEIGSLAFDPQSFATGGQYVQVWTTQ